MIDESSSPHPPFGRFEILDWRDGCFRIAGWMLMPGAPIDRFEIDVPGSGRMPAERVLRRDVQAVFPSDPQALRSGFRFQGGVPGEPPGDGARVTVCGIEAGGGEHRLAARLFSGIDALPLPPEPLRVRVSSVASVDGYVASGFQHYAALEAAVMRHLDGRPPSSLLDWGCGCGRLLSLIRLAVQPVDLAGCDVDSEAIRWCREHLPGPDYEVSGFEPPLPYEDGRFDVIIGYSVMTHLAGDLQLRWLADLRRVLAPGGILVLTTHGEWACRLSGGTRLADLVIAGGISDGTVDGNLDGIAPRGYYRTTFQSRAYTERAWSAILPVVEYLPLGLNHQDIVVLRK